MVSNGGAFSDGVRATEFLKFGTSDGKYGRREAREAIGEGEVVLAAIDELVSVMMVVVVVIRGQGE